MGATPSALVDDARRRARERSRDLVIESQRLAELAATMRADGWQLEQLADLALDVLKSNSELRQRLDAREAEAAGCRAALEAAERERADLARRCELLARTLADVRPMVTPGPCRGEADPP